ncbi:hypothetical protein GF337_04695 [candidate division KSB1 bacterium]|nr:hypothetical protein [candidate division KSB1 bacterium]
MTKNLHKYFEDLEKRINPEIEEVLFQQWREFASGNYTGQIFKPERSRKSPPKIEWQQITINEAIRDPEKMILQQLGECSRILEHGTGEILSIRANYGTGILPSLFGAEIFWMDDSAETLPTVRPFKDAKVTIRRLIDQGIPAIDHSFGGQTLEMGERFMELKMRYPLIGKHVHIYHPDLQSPMDVCELLWGSRLFLAVVDQPELVMNLLTLVTDRYIEFMKEWDEIVAANNDGFAVHWYCLHRGHIMLRDDSAMNFSAEMYGEFIKPYNQKLLNEFNGGAVHFCGTGDHFIDQLAEMDGIYAIDMRQPHLNDLEKIFSHTIHRGNQLVRFPQETARQLVASGRNLHGNIHCW